MLQPDTCLALIKEHLCVLTNVKVLKIKNDRKKLFCINVQNFSLALKNPLKTDIY